MPHVVLTRDATLDLKRLQDFLKHKNPRSAQRAADAIRAGLRSLAPFPEKGRPIEGGDGNLRELFIEYGSNGYVAKYSFLGNDVSILAIKHGREGSYREEGL